MNCGSVRETFENGHLAIAGEAAGPGYTDRGYTPDNAESTRRRPSPSGDCSDGHARPRERGRGAVAARWKLVVDSLTAGRTPNAVGFVKNALTPTMGGARIGG